MANVVAGEDIEKTETVKIIYARRAIRKYKDKPVDRKLIEQVLDAGRMAPLAITLGYGDESPEAHERIRDNALFID